MAQPPVVDIWRRGTVCFATLPGGFGHDQDARPVLVLSHAEVNTALDLAIVLTITSTVPDDIYPVVWHLPDGLLPKPSWVQIAQPRSVPRRALRDPLARLDSDQMDEIVAGLRQLID